MTDANDITHAIVNAKNIRNMIDAGMLGDSTITIERSLTNYIDKCIIDQIKAKL